MKNSYSLLVHGGAGNVLDISEFMEPLQYSLSEGEQLLKMGSRAVEVAVHCVMILEDHQRLNAGIGSALTREGSIEMESAVMNGADLTVGSVAGIDRVSNPVEVADLIRKDPEIVRLIGSSSVDYAIDKGIVEINPNDLITQRQLNRLAEWRIHGGVFIDGSREEKMGTVGAVVFDGHGELAAATSTGGTVGKRKGRVGDTSIIGAGTLADGYVAVSATGKGEDFVRARTASRVSTLVEHGAGVIEASEKAMHEVERLGGRGGLISVDHTGTIGSAKTESTQGLIHGAVSSNTLIRISLDPSAVTTPLR